MEEHTYVSLPDKPVVRRCMFVRNAYEHIRDYDFFCVYV